MKGDSDIGESGGGDGEGSEDGEKLHVLAGLPAVNDKKKRRKRKKTDKEKRALLKREEVNFLFIDFVV